MPSSTPRDLIRKGLDDDDENDPSSILGHNHERTTTPDDDITRTKKVIIQSTKVLFLLLTFHRISNAWMIRTQFDPDEYWQMLEPAYCLAFGSSSSTTTMMTMTVGKMEMMEMEEDDGDAVVRNDDHSFGVGDSGSGVGGGEHRGYGCALTWEWTRRWKSPSESTTPATTATAHYTTMTSNNIRHHIQSMIQRALHGPVRSYVSILPTYWYYLVCRSIFDYANNDDDDGDDYDDAVDDGRGNYRHVPKEKKNHGQNQKHTVGYSTDAVHSYFKRIARYITRHYATYLISKGPCLLHAMLIAAPTDLSVYLIADRLCNLQNGYNSSLSSQSSARRSIMSSWPFWALLCTMTSWFHGYALIRTYANSMEAMCLSVGMALLGPVRTYCYLLTDLRFIVLRSIFSPNTFIALLSSLIIGDGVPRRDDYIGTVWRWNKRIIIIFSER